MSMLDKMTILGIRSFGVDDKDRQAIEFQHPLTLIVGQNGAGKTTIIECLKFVTTGDQPANTRGGAFVHDPKLLGESEVRAQACLKFCDIKGNVMSIQRSLQLTQKANKATMKTLDSVIKKTIGGEIVSNTSKCADVNAAMVNALGVSKAVLENVIFCHQEDSNWPLSEGKVLKNKFDDIFAATRYIKALEAIESTRKAKDQDLREEKEKLPYLKSNQDTANEKKKKLKEFEIGLSATEDSINQVKRECKPVEDGIRNKEQQRNELAVLENKKRQHVNRLKDIKEDRKLLEDRIQNIFGGTDEQLQQVIQSQGRLMAQKRNKLQENEQKIEPMKRKIDNLKEKNNKMTLKEGELRQEFKSFQDRKSERAVLLKDASESYEICGGFKFDASLSEDDTRRFEGEMNKLVKKTEESLMTKQNLLDKELAVKDKEIQSVWSSKTEIQERIKHKQQAIKEKRKKIQETDRDIRTLQSSSDADRLEDLQTQLEHYEKELESSEKSFNVNELKEEEKKLNRMKHQLESKLKDVDEEIMNMQEHEQSRAKIDYKKEDRSKKEETVKRSKRRNIDNLSSLNILDSCDDLDKVKFPTRSELNMWISRKMEEEKRMRKELEKKSQERSKSAAQLESLIKELEEKKKRLESIEEVMFELCGSEDFEQELHQVEEDIKALQSEKGLADGIQFMYREFAKKLRLSHNPENTPCPLCHRLFDQANEVEELAKELDDKLQMAPQRRLTQQQELKKKQELYQAFLQQKPAKEEMDKFTKETIPELKSKIADLRSKISSLRQVISEKEEAVRKVQDDCALAQSCSNDVAQIETALAEIKDFTREINLAQAKISRSGSCRKSFEDLKEEKQQLARDVQKYGKSIDDIREKIEKQTSTKLSLTNHVKSLQDEKLKIASDVEKCKQLKIAKKAIEGEIENLIHEYEESEGKIGPLERRIKDLENEKSADSEKRKNEIKAENDYLQSMKAKRQEIVKMNGNIKRYIQSGRQNLLEKTQAESRNIDSELERVEDDLNKTREEISKIEKDFAMCKDRQRDLDDNLALRKQDETILKVQKSVEELTKRLGNGNSYSQLDREINNLNERREELAIELERCKERQTQTKERVQEIKKEMDKDDYKYADERYKDCLIATTTLKLATEDLKKYHNALDRAIMRYHGLKMSEINKIIRQIWTETYKGSDIEYIEICSDEDTVSTSSRRVYNYRLVKCCNGRKIDMRGRCSAGQKVLASLVIRLALAETFCINCGILALDEPTTNLDRHHIESLAGALVSIIESRQQQRNFQLIIITHDEDFVEILARSSNVDHFFRVKKCDGKSRIFVCPIDTLD